MATETPIIVPAVPYDFTPWLTYAKTKIGIHELPGFDYNNPFIVECLTKAGLPGQPDETAWCASFVNRCMLEIGIAGPHHPAAARSWLHFGIKLDAPVHGCVVVFSRPPDPTHGHVGFYDSETSAGIQTLGGNENNSVMIKPYAKDRLLGYFWPVGYSLPDGTMPGQPSVVVS